MEFYQYIWHQKTRVHRPPCIVGRSNDRFSRFTTTPASNIDYRLMDCVHGYVTC